ncbi:BatA domain-containing protein [Solitalea koreensis]|uniref:N-terminal double-transmembrane domain-containing protein n=1 Tax=Solitalea koreensis TaxID=543615 RepID=A0A521BK10_9SPHI|nr:BatA domain-containing protein [Solitalea koreensis]SMO47467.1 N-terminal double-transmembrane domain-containing protein [Solitalea koreensis]
MNFLYPSFLYALAGIAIPIIVHLFNFRKFKRVEFTNVRFLKEIKHQTNSRSKLKHLLILASRILSVLFLVLAFAQPFIPKNQTSQAGKNHIYSIYVDNSYSMDARNAEGCLLDEAKRKAKSIATSAGLNDRFQLLTNDFEGKHQRLVDKETFNNFLDEVMISPNKHRMDEIIARQKDLLSTSGNGLKSVYLISDFQLNTIDSEKLRSDSTIRITALPVTGAHTVNVSVDSVWFISPIHKPGETETLVVQLRNFTDQDAESVPVKLLLNGEQKAIGNVKVKARASAIDTLSYKTSSSGWQKGEVQISDYPITFDDKLYFSYKIDDKVNVLTISGNATNPYINAVYRSDDYFSLSNNEENKIDYSLIPQQKLIVLDQLKTLSGGLAQQLKKYLEAGGSVMIFPGLGSDLKSYNDFLLSVGVDRYGKLNYIENKVDLVNLQADVFNGVFENIPHNPDWPKVKRYYTMDNVVRTNRETLMRLQGNQSLISKYRIASGKLYLSSVPLDDSLTNLPRHAVFVPMMYKVAMLSSSRHPLYYVIGQTSTIETAKLPPSVSNNYKFKNKQLEFIPDVRNNESSTNLYIDDQVKKEGIYQFLNGNQELAVFGFNFDRSESDLSYYSDGDLDKILSQKKISLLNTPTEAVGKVIQEENSGIRLWKYCVILCLIFLALEILLIRFWKSSIAEFSIKEQNVMDKV